MDETLRPTAPIRHCTQLARMTCDNEDTAKKIRNDVATASRNRLA